MKTLLLLSIFLNEGRDKDKPIILLFKIGTQLSSRKEDDLSIYLRSLGNLVELIRNIENSARKY